MIEAPGETNLDCSAQIDSYEPTIPTYTHIHPERVQFLRDMLNVRGVLGRRIGQANRFGRLHCCVLSMYGRLRHSRFLEFFASRLVFLVPRP